MTGATTTSDVLPALDAWPQQPAPLRQAAEQLLSDSRASGPDTDRREHVDEAELRRALLAGYPDRVARRREAGSPRLLLATGAGAELARDSGVRDAEWLVALDVAGATSGGDARVFAASAIERDWLSPTQTSVEHTLTDAGARPRDPRDVVRRAAPRRSAGRHRTRQRSQHCSPTHTSRGRTTRPPRSCCVGCASSAPTSTCQRWSSEAAAGVRSVDDIDLAAHLPWELRMRLEREAPERLDVPSGRTAALDYRDDGSVAASVKLQELFGLAETPRIGPRGEPVLLLLLAPNGRPVQTTRDLRSFWERTYPEVRKELRGRYPRHPWPDDPWTATPTARTKRKDGT